MGEEKKRKEQAAALVVRKVIQRLRIATPENFEDLRAELETAQAENLDKMGPQGEKVQMEADKALQQAQQRVTATIEKREQEKREKEEEEKKRKEEEEAIEKMVAESTEEGKALDEVLEKAEE